MTPFQKFLEQRGFQPDACEATTHPDFYRLAESMHATLMEIKGTAYHSDYPAAVDLAYSFLNHAAPCGDSHCQHCGWK